MLEVNETWRRVERWLAENWPEGLDTLLPAATDDEIKSLEDAIGLKLPEDFVASLRVHNGQKSMSGALFPSGELLSAAEIEDQWRVWKELLDSGDFDGCQSEPLSPAIRPDWWSPSWIPVTHDGWGNHDCLDLNPAASGTRGQIITMWHDSPDRQALAQSFAEWFSQYAGALYSGAYVYSADDNRIVDRE